MRKTHIRVFFVLLSAVFVFVNSASAINFVGATSDGGTTWTFAEGDRSAEAIFAYSNDTSGYDLLTVTLTNTATHPTDTKLTPVFLLQAVWFDITNNVLLTPITAELNASTIEQEGTKTPNPLLSTIADDDVSGEFAYRGDLSTPLINASQGISAVGYGTDSFDGFGTNDLFNPVNWRTEPPAPNGMNYGLTPENFSSLTDINGGVTNQPVIDNSVIFTLSFPDLPGIGITNVSFEYGTDLEAVPVPSTIFLLGTGILGLGLYGRRMRKK